MQPTQVVEAFVAAINSSNPAGIENLLAEDSVLIDSLGHRLAGRTALRTAWETYLRWMPDYLIEVDSMLAHGEIVAIFGRAAGTYAPDGKLVPENHWCIPAAWRATVRAGLIASWQIYADNKPVYEIMLRAGRSNLK